MQKILINWEHTDDRNYKRVAPKHRARVQELVDHLPRMEAPDRAVGHYSWYVNIYENLPNGIVERVATIIFRGIAARTVYGVEERAPAYSTLYRIDKSNPNQWKFVLPKPAKKREMEIPVLENIFSESDKTEMSTNDTYNGFRGKTPPVFFMPKNLGYNISLMEEILANVSPTKDVYTLEISIPREEYEYDFELDYQIDSIQKSIDDCLKLHKNMLGGNIKDTSVTNFNTHKAEIMFELDYFDNTKLNRKRGNKFRDNVGEALKQCSDFTVVNVEGGKDAKGKDVNNRHDTPKGPRYVDIQLKHKSGKVVNIEVKRGNSRYHKEQQAKDRYLEKQGLGKTYVVRGEKKRKGREI